MQHAAATKRFGEPSALGLLGLAIGCAALLPAAFGAEGSLTPPALRTAAWFCLLFGGGCQFLSGLMSFANGNSLGGTLLTTFSFNWVMNWWALSELAEGRLPSASVVLAVDASFLLVFLVMTWAFAYSSKLFVALLLDIDLLFALRIARDALHVPVSFGIACCTVILMGLALYIAFAVMLYEASGRLPLPIPGPLLAKAPPASA
jgi:succinate-acetate transporter protein